MLESFESSYYTYDCCAAYIWQAFETLMDILCEIKYSNWCEDGSNACNIKYMKVYLLSCYENVKYDEVHWYYCLLYKQ